MTQFDKIICMIPARMGSQRLKQKNMRLINGIPLITHAIRKAKQIDIFDEIWVNSEHNAIKQVALQEGVEFYQRSKELSDNTATSEDFVYDFMKKQNSEYLVQLHTIAPLLEIDTIKNFTNHLINRKIDAQFSVVLEQIECCCEGQPINFSTEKKTNSQELKAIQRITWSITGWRTNNYIQVYEQGKCATYNGEVNYFPIDRIEGTIIKDEIDLKLANAFGGVKI